VRTMPCSSPADNTQSLGGHARGSIVSILVSASASICLGSALLSSQGRHVVAQKYVCHASRPLVMPSDWQPLLPLVPHCYKICCMRSPALIQTGTSSQKTSSLCAARGPVAAPALRTPCAPCLAVVWWWPTWAWQTCRWGGQRVSCWAP